MTHVLTGNRLHKHLDAAVVLQSVVDQLKRHYRLSRIRILDVPCGSMEWMSRFLAMRDDIDYTGVDIVPDMIDKHRKTYAERPSWNFILSDIVHDGINTSAPYDLIVCRYMLQHLHTADVLPILGNLSAVGTATGRPAYLLATTFGMAKSNIEVAADTAWRFRQLNLEIQPFSLEPPLCAARDYPLEFVPFHTISLWKLPLRKVQNCSTVKKFRVKSLSDSGIYYSCVNWSL